LETAIPSGWQFFLDKPMSDTGLIVASEPAVKKTSTGDQQAEQR
jgi:hypothetical protein